jgi:hypothetical protein
VDLQDRLAAEDVKFLPAGAKLANASYGSAVKVAWYIICAVLVINGLLALLLLHDYVLGALGLGLGIGFVGLREYRRRRDARRGTNRTFE